MDSNRNSSGKLPAGLAGVLNAPEEKRDSAYYSQGDPASKHNSTLSTSGHSAATPPSSGYQSSVTEKTPSPIATSMGPQPLSSPTSGGMSVASMVSPTSSSNEYSVLRRLDSGPNSAGLPPSEDGDSRRQSVDSRLGHNFGDLRLAGSPYASHNQSATSLQSALAQQRNPTGASDRNSNARLSNGYQPQRLPDALSPRMMIRTAPAITGPAPGSIARAPEAIAGQAWAFPDETIVRLPSSARPSEDTASRRGTSFLGDSRRSSVADSIASSQYTTESRLPAGQRRLEDGIAPGHLSRESSDLQVAHHHHSLQHRQIGELQNEEGDSPGSSQPYSRTPELRVSHKLAERKRRTEMKELFDTLRDAMPQERGSKASKWEILTKAIHEYNKAKDEIVSLKRLHAVALQDLDNFRRDCNALRMENGALRSDFANQAAQLGAMGDALRQRDEEISHLREENNRLHGIIVANGIDAGPSNNSSQMNAINGINGVNHMSPPAHTNGYSQDQYNRLQRPVDGYAPRATEQLPPIRNISASVQGPDSMSGVQYQNEPRINGYRPDQQRY